MLHAKVALFSVVVILSIGAYSALIGDEIEPFFTGQEFIFGGYRARPGQFPYQASLRVNASRGFFHNCGGTLITNRFVVTAAHCFPPRFLPNETDRFQLVLGAHNRSSADDGEAYAVERIFVHPGWNSTLIINDVGLVQTVRNITFTSAIAPIPISRRFIDTSLRAVTSGWGRTDDQYDSLKFAFLYTLTNDECRQRIRAQRKEDPVHDFSTLCGFSVRTGTGVCSGDSGGPLVYKGELIGVTSWAYLCALGIPDGFCRVSEYVPWIEEQINSTRTQPLLPQLN